MADVADHVLAASIGEDPMRAVGGQGRYPEARPNACSSAGTRERLSQHLVLPERALPGRVEFDPLRTSVRGVEHPRETRRRAPGVEPLARAGGPPHLLGEGQHGAPIAVGHADQRRAPRARAAAFDPGGAPPARAALRAPRGKRTEDEPPRAGEERGAEWKSDPPARHQRHRAVRVESRARAPASCR